MIFVKVHKIRPFWSLIQSMAYPGRFAIQFLYNQGWITGVRLHRPTALYRLLDYSPEKFTFLLICTLPAYSPIQMHAFLAAGSYALFSILKTAR